LGVSILESTQGDFFEIYSTYMGSNENMDEFSYIEQTKGNDIQLEYIVNLYEENILTTTQTYVVIENFTQKILYRPVIKFSNTTAVIDVELRIVNKVDGSYIQKFGSLGIKNSINKYGLRLTQLNLNSNVIKPEIYNLKLKNTMSVNSVIDSMIDIMKVPYPVMYDKYRILAKSTNASVSTNSYVPNGILEILITPFDNIIQFNIAQDINSNGEPVPYNLGDISSNSNFLLVFKSDSEKLEKEPFYEADNNYELGNIYYKIEENDLKLLRRIYDKGYTNFYIVVNSNGYNTQLYSGKFIFYEDVTFIDSNNTITTSGNTILSTNTTSNTTSNINTTTNDTIILNTENIDTSENKVAANLTANNSFNANNMQTYTENVDSNKNYNSVMVYVRFQINMDKMDTFIKDNQLTAYIKYGNVYYFDRLYITIIETIKKQEFIEKVFIIPLGIGMV
jgi:hypothetical protein